MGYYTKFDLTIHDGFIADEQVLRALVKTNSGYFSVDNHSLEECFCEEMKWYDHEKDMRAVSKMFPDVVFALEGEGEDSSDMWVKYFKNGKMQTCYARIEFDPYDPTMLK